MNDQTMRQAFGINAMKTTASFQPKSISDEWKSIIVDLID